MFRNTSTTSSAPTRRRLSAATVLAATVATAVAGVTFTATPASAGVVVNKPWKHTVTVETTNVEVFQHNWIRADVKRTSGYLSQSFTHADGHGGYSIRLTPFAEDTGGQLVVSDSENFSDGSKPGTSVYDGTVFVGARLDMTVKGRGAQFPRDYPDYNINTYNLGTASATGWRHIEVVGAGGDYIKMDYRVSHTATPQN